MQITVEINSQSWRVRQDHAISLAIPLNFHGPQVNHFDARPAQMAPMKAGSFVGDTRQGGSCNVPELFLNPHCNGTHTESISHVIDAQIPVYHAVNAALIPARLITVVPVLSEFTSETYQPALDEWDQVITRESLAAALAAVDDVWCEALVVRTLPNDAHKTHARYDGQNAPAFFTFDAILYLRERGVHHLLVDLPSLDRLHDEGRLGAHRHFWQLEESGHALSTHSLTTASVTELIFVPDSVADGAYLLNLQIPAFRLDVAPCRPLLIPLEPVHA